MAFSKIFRLSDPRKSVEGSGVNFKFVGVLCRSGPSLNSSTGRLDLSGENCPSCAENFETVLSTSTFPGGPSNSKPSAASKI